MCKFYSAIVMKNGDLLHNENLKSHEDIIRLFNINDSQVNCDKFVRVEFTPENDFDFADIEKYKLNIDESSTPKWFEKHREYIISRLKEIVSKRIITSDQKILTGGLYVVKNCKIYKLICAQVIYMQATQVNVMRGNSQVNVMRENSQVNEMWENSQVNVMRENSQVNVMWENSQVNEMRENSQVNVMRGNSQVNVMRGNSQVNVMRENSQVNEMWENSQVNEMRENSQVNEMRGNSQVNEMWENSQVNEMRGNSQVNVMRDNSQVKSNNSSKSLPKK
jgi:hypothetical protein